VSAAIVVATLANGATSFLKRIGVLERAQYEAYWQAHCGEDRVRPRALGLGRRCLDAVPGPLASDRYFREAPLFRFVFEVGRTDFKLKLVKDGLVAVLILGSFALVLRGGGAPPNCRNWPLCALAALIAVVAIADFASGKWLAALFGLRGMTFVAIALFGAWLKRPPLLRDVCRGLIVLLVVEAALVPVELLWGMPISGYAVTFALPNRVAGTLVKANTLGILAAVTVAAAEAVDPRSAWRTTAWIAGFILVSTAGSGTGWVILAVLAARLALGGARSPARVGALAVAALVLGAVLPMVVGRPDLYDSIGAKGRLGMFRTVLAGSPLWRGNGLSVAAPTDRVAPQSTFSRREAGPRGSDSTLILFLEIFGVPGALLLYAALAVAWRDGDGLRPLVLALGLASVTLTLPFAFPLNVMLGLALARDSDRPDQANRDPA
jgi:hypothetical protein